MRKQRNEKKKRWGVWVSVFVSSVRIIPQELFSNYLAATIYCDATDAHAECAKKILSLRRTKRAAILAAYKRGSKYWKVK